MSNTEKLEIEITDEEPCCVKSVVQYMANLRYPCTHNEGSCLGCDYGKNVWSKYEKKSTDDRLTLDDFHRDACERLKRHYSGDKLDKLLRECARDSRNRYVDYLYHRIVHLVKNGFIDIWDAKNNRNLSVLTNLKVNVASHHVSAEIRFNAIEENKFEGIGSEADLYEPFDNNERRNSYNNFFISTTDLRELCRREYMEVVVIPHQNAGTTTNATLSISPETYNAESQQVDDSATNITNISSVKQKDPWMVKNPEDHSPIHEWYTYARYFAREALKENPSLTNDELAIFVEAKFKECKIYKRGNKGFHGVDTIKKAFTGVKLKLPIDHQP